MKQDKFAVLRINSRQFVVHEGQILKVDRVGEDTSVEVLLYVEGGEIAVGEPVLENHGAVLSIISQEKDKKIPVRRFKSKSRYRKNRGHRQPVSIVEVEKIGKVKGSLKVKEPKVKDGTQKGTRIHKTAGKPKRKA